ncbi:hypothetical protein COOONC_09002 [Cooperia oncophora]
MNIPVLSDFNKKIARNFGVLDEVRTIKRAHFTIS